MFSVTEKSLIQNATKNDFLRFLKNRFFRRKEKEIVMPPCKVPQYCYHGGIGRDQQLLTSPVLTAQGFSFCRHQQYFNSRYCQLPTIIPGVRFYGSKDFAKSTINHSLITKINIYILIYQIYIQLHFS